MVIAAGHGTVPRLQRRAAGSVAGTVGIPARTTCRPHDHNRRAGGRSAHAGPMRRRAARAGSPAVTGRMLCMWMFLSRRLRIWVLLCIALPLARVLIHRLALAAEHRNPSARTARALHQADSAVTAVSRRAGRKAARRPRRVR
jgi:hypothetical protein